MENDGKVIALLIDAENVSPKYIKTIIDEVSMYGTPAYKRIYGDWTAPDMVSWKKMLLEHNLTPIQQFSYTQGKNASDSAMIIDAMDILYTKNVDGFCIVSSDSDFTRLAARLRESRMFVIGMGESKTPTAFKSACDTFKYLDVLMGMKKETLPVAVSEKASKQPAQQPKAAKKQAQPAQPKKAAGKKGQKPEPEKEPEPVPAAPAEPHHDEELAAAFVSLDEIVAKIREIVEHDSEPEPEPKPLTVQALIAQSVEDLADEDGYAYLGDVGTLLLKKQPDFDSRNYGFSKLHKLIDYTKAFETKYEQFENGGKNLVIRNKG